jgi:hypothetical protein
MGKKNRINKLFERTRIESVDARPDSPESAAPESQVQPESPLADQEAKRDASSRSEDSAGDRSVSFDQTHAGPADSASSDVLNEATRPKSNPQERDVGASSGSQGSLEPAGDEETSGEDILQDLRRALKEEEADSDQQDSKWWRRFGRRKREALPEPAPVEMDLPAVPDPGVSSEMPAREDAGEPEVDQIEEAISWPATEPDESTVESSIPAAEAAHEPELWGGLDELKKQAFQPRPGKEPADALSDVRSIVLEGGEEVLVEVDSKPVNLIEERLSAFENALKPYRRYVYTAFALLGAAVVVTGGLILFNIYQRSRPEPVKEVSNLPYPRSVALPGGWSFGLGTGTLKNGRWEPRGAEWLEGTEVCRWVSLPWSTQLEAVIRTLNPRDPIVLSMSNKDKLVYNVNSVRELSPQQIQALDSNSPCLLLILTQADSQKHWVVTALPK